MEEELLHVLIGGSLGVAFYAHDRATKNKPVELVWAVVSFVVGYLALDYFFHGLLEAGHGHE